ncbi:hypothetical protein AB0L53_33255 [Nonomuraea sp. NPDC052129]|uniref:hypothetical protein n=1 Tax=Nonomuraea sp. NPDC052129 TaxID=3154651 RepID=UPI0034364B27
MGSYDDDTLPLQPPVRLPADDELVAAVRETPLATGDADASAHPAFAPDAVEALRDGSDDKVLQVWADVCRRTLSTDETLFMEVVRLYLGRGPLTDEVPAVLTDLGLVRQAPPRTLTPLGIWAAGLVIGEATGQDIPVMGSLAGRDAGALLYGLRSYPEPERDEELAGWLAGRDQGEAAAEIAAALGEVSPLSRAVGVELLATGLGDAGTEALDGLLGAPRMGAVVAARLGREERPPTPEEIAWAFVDMAAALLEFGGEAAEVIKSVSQGMEKDEQAGTIALLALGDHPWTERVLQVFIDHHPDERVVAAARKALRRHGLMDARG